MSRKILTTSLLFVACLLFPGTAQAKSFYFPEVRINYQINKDASVDVKEERTFRFDGSFTKAYWDIPLAGNQRMEEIKVGGGAETYTVANNGGTVHIEARHSSFNEDKTFVLTYKLMGAVQKYQDAGEFYWKAVGDEWGAKTDLVQVTISIPEEAGRENIYIWGHGPLNGRAEIIDGQRATWTISNLPEKQWVEVRMLFPSAIISGEAINKNRIGEVKNEEKGFQDKTILEQKVKLGGLVAIPIFLVGWIIYWIRVWRKEGKEYDVGGVPKYIHNPPSKIAPALVEALVSQEQTVTPNSFSATILDLARRGVIKIEAREKYSMGFLGIGGGRKQEYILHFNKDNAAAYKGLAAFEIDVVDHVFGSADDGLQISIADLSDKMRGDRYGTKYFFQKFTEDVKKAGDVANFVEDESKGLRTKFILLNTLAVGLVLLVITLIFGLALMGLLIWGTVLAGGFFYMIGRGLLRWNKKYTKEAREWLGFKNFLNDFSHFKDELPQALIIWEKMLVYGTVLGVAKKVASSLPLILSQQGATIPAWYYVTGGNGAPIGVGNLAAGISQNFATSFSQSFSNLSTVMSSSFSSGSGGGFSGGGGGGGGGGGAS